MAREGPTDDEKTRRAQAAIDEARRMLNDRAFSGRLTRGERDRLETAADEASAQLALYRGALIGQGTGPGPLAVVATATTGEPLSAGAVAVIALCFAAIGVLSSAQTRGDPTDVGRRLDRALQNLAESFQRSDGGASPSGGASEQAVPLRGSPDLGPDLLRYLTSVGVIVGAGASMAVMMGKLKEVVRATRDQIEANIDARAGMRCSDKLIRFRQLTQQILDALAAPRPADPTEQGQQVWRTVNLFKDWMRAVNELLECLGMTPIFPV